MAYIQTTGQSPDGKSHPLPIAGVAAYTTKLLAANEPWESPIISYKGNDAVIFALQTDQIGSYIVEYYNDEVKNSFSGNPTIFDPSLLSSFQAGLHGKGNGVRIVYTNGPVAQTVMYAEVRVCDDIQETLRSVAIPVSSTNMAGTTHAVIEGRENGAGVYKQNTVTTNGAKIGLDVNILNPSSNTATDVSALAKDATLKDGTQKTQVTNFPATQPVSGTVAVSNQPTTLAVSNFPATQPVSGTVAVSNQPSTIGVSNFPATQQVGGTVAISNFPASENVIVTNFPVTQIPPTVGAKQTLTIAANATVTIAANTARKGVVIASSSGTLFIALGFTATATDWTYRIITNGIAEIPELWSGVSISIFSSAASTGTATLLT